MRVTMGMKIEPVARLLQIKPETTVESAGLFEIGHRKVDVVERMRAGQVPIAFVRGVNPAHVLPKSLNFAEAFAKVPFKVSFSSYPDETTELCDVIVPDLHSLESWGDAEPLKGVIGLQQPVMDPVFPTNSKAIPVAPGTAL